MASHDFPSSHAVPASVARRKLDRRGSVKQGRSKRDFTRRHLGYGSWIADDPVPINLREVVDGYGLTFSNLELRAHLRLLIVAWDGDEVGTGRLPLNERTLATVARVSRPTWRRIRAKALTGFQRHADVWIHPGLVRKVSDEREAAQKAGRTPLSRKLRFMVLERDGYKCCYCGRSCDEVPLEIDHVHPVALGGTDDIDNLRAACVDCNAGKRDRPTLAPRPVKVQ